MPLMTPNPNGSGDGLDDDLTDGDIVLRDENGNEIHFQPLEWEEEESAKAEDAKIVKKEAEEKTKK